MKPAPDPSRGWPRVQPAPLPLHWALGLLVASVAVQAVQGLLFSPLPSVTIPLLAMIMVAIRCRSSLQGALFGALAGCAYDGLGHGPVGLHGIALTIIGYCVTSLANNVRIHGAGAITCLCGTLFVAHQSLHRLIQILLLGRSGDHFTWQLLPNSLLHAGLGMLMWLMLNRVVRDAKPVVREARRARNPGIAIPGAERVRVRRAGPSLLGNPDSQR